MVIRYVGQDYSPGGLSLGRLLVGSACLSVIMLLGRRWVPMTRQEWGLVTLIGVLWFGVYSVAPNAGEQHVDAGTVAMLIQLAPIAIALGWILLGEVPALLAVVGSVISLIGVGIARRPTKPIR